MTRGEVYDARCHTCHLVGAHTTEECTTALHAEIARLTARPLVKLAPQLPPGPIKIRRLTSGGPFPHVAHISPTSIEALEWIRDVGLHDGRYYLEHGWQRMTPRKA